MSKFGVNFGTKSSVNYYSLYAPTKHGLMFPQDLHAFPIEYRLLTTFVQYAGKVLTHRFLLKAVRGSGRIKETHYLCVFTANLRHKLEVDPSRPRYLLTEHGVGYCLATE